MTTLLAFCSFLLLAHAAIEPLQHPPSPPEEDQVFQLFYDLCTSGRVPQTGLMSHSGNKPGQKTMLLCKQKELVGASRRQQIFVEPSPVNYQHKLVVHAEQVKGNRSRTTVFVIPPQVKHEYDVQVEQGPSRGLAEKPDVYFLSRPVRKSEAPASSTTTKPSFKEEPDKLTDEEQTK